MTRAPRIVNFVLLIGFFLIANPTIASAQRQMDKVQLAEAHLHLGLLYLPIHDEGTALENFRQPRGSTPSAPSIRKFIHRKRSLCSCRRAPTP